MEIFNVGIPELLLILTLMLILLGPEGMATTARNLAKSIRKFLHSPLWADMVKTQREIRDIPTRLVREAGYEEFRAEIDNAKADFGKIKNETKEAYHSAAVPLQVDEFSIRPPKVEPKIDAAPTQPVEEAKPENEAEKPPRWTNLTGGDQP